MSSEPNILTDSIYFCTDYFNPVLNLSLVWSCQIREDHIDRFYANMKLSFLIFGIQQFAEAQFPGRYMHELQGIRRELKQGTVLKI